MLILLKHIVKENIYLKCFVKGVTFMRSIAKVKKWLTVGCASLCIAGIAGGIAQAASVGVNLHIDEKQASTACLGNTTGKYQWTCIMGIPTIKKEAEFVLYQGKDSKDCTHRRAKKYMAPGDAQYQTTLSVDKDKYTVAKVTIYANNKTDPQEGAIAGTVLKNY